jgi:hypothetical protein
MGLIIAVNAPPVIKKMSKERNIQLIPLIRRRRPFLIAPPGGAYIGPP